MNTKLQQRRVPFGSELLDSASIAEFVKNEIRSAPNPKKTGSSYSLILCPYHSEKTPSGRVKHDASKGGVGTFKCYGCGVTKTWNELASTLGLRQYGKKEMFPDGNVPVINFSQYEDAFLSTEEGARHEDLRFYPMTEENAELVGLKNNTWRDFHLDFLRDQIGARFCYIEYQRRFYVYLPINLNGEEVGYIKARLFKPLEKSEPSYINSSGPWSLKKGLFPFDPAIDLMKSLGLTTMALVEGPRDALRLIREGIPAVSMMGTHSWSDTKTRALEMAGVTRVVIFMDGDPAGKNATRFLRTGLKTEASEEPIIKPLKETFDTKTLRLWLIEGGDSMDPGNCPEYILEHIKTALLT